MFKPENKIIIVDDQVEHLKKLGDQFQNRGIGCRLCEYDVFFDTPFTGVRIAFFDINLNPSGTDGNSSLIPSKLAEAISQYIGKGNGPYALIFWTSHKEQIDEFKQYVSERHPDFAKPFVVDCIDKQEFLNNNKTLEQKLEQILGDKTIELLFDFENIVSESAYKTINQIYDIIPKNDLWGYNENFKENFEKIFSKIAVSVLGIAHAKLNPDKAVYEALMPTLNYHIVKSLNQKKWDKYLESLKKARSYKDIKPPEGFKESELNSVFHIDSNEQDFPLDTRGAVIEMEKKSDIFKAQFNIEFDSWFNAILPIKESKLRKEIRNASTLIAIELSAACDYSNQKSRLNKYMMGVKIPIINRDTAFGEIKLPDCSFYIGEFSLNNEDFQLWGNLNFVFGATPGDVKLKKPHFILKKEIMDMIGNKYANHISRIGITSF